MKNRIKITRPGIEPEKPAKIEDVNDPIKASKQRQKDNISKTRLVFQDNKRKFREKIWPVWRSIINFTLNQKTGVSMSGKQGWFKKKLKSEKFWQGIATMLAAVGVSLNPEAATEIGIAAVAVIGAVRAVANNWGRIFEKDD